ncbi:MAG: HD domain-containing protein [Acidobacteriota bacterium]
MGLDFKDSKDAQDFLKQLGAPTKLINHVALVSEAGELLIEKLTQLNVKFDEKLVKLAIIFHDTGKIIHLQELTEPGNNHEPEGERLLLEYGVEPKIARCCLSHARWRDLPCSFEELLVALSDKLWKGVRVEELELKIIDKVAELMGKSRWEIFIELDSCFEMIASDGVDRLLRS